MKSEGVKEVVKWMEQELKKQKEAVEAARKQLGIFGHFEDCGSSYEYAFVEEQAKLAAMVSWKISTEKFMKKLRHEGQ